MRYTFGGFELDEELLELKRDGARVAAQPKTLDILLYLVKHRDRTVLKRELLDAVWPGVTVTEAAVWRAMLRVRETIGDEEQKVVSTVRGRGFRFVAPVVVKSAATAHPPSRELDPTLVGRAMALATLEARLDAAMAGRGSAVLVTGPRGIGKTRLTDEVARRARARGARVVASHVPADVEVPPMWPWSRAVGELGEIDPASTELRDCLESLARATGDDELRGFDAFARALSEAARRAPLVLAFDDLERAAPRPIGLLRHVVRTLAGGPTLVVAAVRDPPWEEEPRARALAALFTEVSHVVALRGLGADEVAQVVERARGRLPTAGLAKELVERSGGNPHYLHQLLKTEPVERALDDGAGALSTTLEIGEGLAISIGRHLEALPGPARELLTVAAVLGREVDLPRLVAVTGLTGPEILGHLEEAQRRRLVVATGGGLRFDPPLIRDVVYARLGGVERAALHLRAGERLSAHHGEAAALHAAELARHFTRALPWGDPARALDFAVRAAEQDVARGAHRRAARHWSLAVQALTHLAGERSRLVEVQLGLAGALGGAGDPAAAREGFLDAAMAARALGLRDGLRAAAVGFAGVAGPGDQELARRLLAETEAET